MALGDLIAKALPKAFTKVGTEVTFRSVAAGAYNTTTGTVAETNTDTEHTGTLSDVTLREVNELIEAGDKILTVPASEFASRPNNKDKIVISTVVHQVITIRVEELNGVDLLYEFVLRA